MKTHTIRLTEKEYELAREQAQINSLNVSDIARLVIAKTVRVKRIPSHIQKVGRGVRLENRDKRLNFKLDAELSQQFKDIVKQHDGNINMSDIFRFYMSTPEQLFERSGKHHKARVSKTKSAKAQDFYQTPTRVTERFLEAHFAGMDISNLTVLEPASGHGAISDVLDAFGFSVSKFDKYFGENRTDFLTDEVEPVDWIITNPPFSQANAFVCRSMEVALNSAMLLPLDFLTSAERYKSIYTNKQFHCSTAYVFTRRILMSQEAQPSTYSTGAVSFAWFVFERGQSDTPISLHHIDNDADILRLK